MTKNKIILIIIGILFLIGVIIGFSYWIQYEKSKISEGEEGAKTLKEISQEEAVAIALENYPGEVYSVSKTETPPLLEGQDPTEEFWMVGINLDEPIEKELPVGSFSTKAEVFINIHTGFISVVGFN